MKEWAATLLGAVLITQIMELLLPQGEMQKYAKLVGGVLVMLVILKPLGELTRTGPKFMEEWIGAQGAMLKTEAAAYEGETHNREIALRFETDLAKHISDYIGTLDTELMATHVEVKVEKDEEAEGFLDILGVKIYVADVSEKDGGITVFPNISENRNEKEKSLIMDNVSRAYNIPKEIITVTE